MTTRVSLGKYNNWHSWTGRLRQPYSKTRPEMDRMIGC